MIDLIIRYSFYLLFFLTPLFWTSINYELFEFNKMLLTYGITVIIVGAWILKSIAEKRFIFNRTPLDIPLLLFLASQILSTVFSIDVHTSLNGYYSRLNGGLYSTFTYLLLYFAFVSNIKREQIKTIFKFILASGFIVSVYAIMEHFGASPSCGILNTQKYLDTGVSFRHVLPILFDDLTNLNNPAKIINAGCWVQDVQARVFATLGQPNWLAGYLAMLIFPALYFFLTAPSRALQTTYYLLLTTLYLAFTFTYSRGPTLGLIGGLLIFVVLHYGRTIVQWNILRATRQQAESREVTTTIKPLLLVLTSFLLINLLFGSALTSFRLVSKFAAPPRPTIALPPTSVTQLENGGTESGQIRFIVWQGALDIFKHYPLLGSGVETFAYSYYQFRPAEHNQTSEWDFLYNKAHNEYLNYLATTGIVGFGAYILVIVTFIWWCIKHSVILSVAKNLKIKSRDPSLIVQDDKEGVQNDKYTLLSVLLAAYISYLIYNFFLFSVVILAIFFFLFPAIAFVATESIKQLKLPSFVNSKLSILNWIYRRPLYTTLTNGLVITFILYTLYFILSLWYADALFAQGQKASDEGNPAAAFNAIATAVELNRNEPFYHSELAYNAAASAVGFESIDATTSAELVIQSAQEMDYVLKTNPNNISYYRTAIRTYFELASLDKDYEAKTLSAIDRAIALAPTDPKLFYNKAKILDFLDRKDEALKVIKKAVELKPDYIEALDQLKKWQEATISGKAK